MLARLIENQARRYRKKQEYIKRVEGLGYEALFLFFASFCWFLIGQFWQLWTQRLRV